MKVLVSISCTRKSEVGKGMRLEKDGAKVEEHQAVIGTSHPVISRAFLDLSTIATP